MHRAKFRSLARQMGGTCTAIRADCYWLRRRLLTHPKMKEEVQWPSREEREANRALLRTAGIAPGMEDVIFIVDGTKDLSKRARIYEEQEKDYSANKGHGRSHSLYVDVLRGRPIRVEAGHEGRHVHCLSCCISHLCPPLSHMHQLATGRSHTSSAHY